MAERDTDQLASDRLNTLFADGRPGFSIGPIDISAASFGSADEWAHSAMSYLSCMLNGTQGGTLGGAVQVSAAAIGAVLGYIERLEIDAGIIPAPGGGA